MTDPTTLASLLHRLRAATGKTTAVLLGFVLWPLCMVFCLIVALLTALSSTGEDT